jgi:tetraacyldisaccharide 4'-kinase
MKIVDFRPTAERIFSGQKRQSPSEPAGKPGWWSRLMDGLVARRVAARPRPSREHLVVSVGNLALGGTGKTPVIIKLAQDLAAGGHRGAVLTRGFKSPLKGPLVVAPEDEGAGDEARLMARVLEPLDWAVIQARQRFRGLELAAGLSPRPDIILLEDGFQTGGVGRHLDVVLLDSWLVEEVAGQEVVVPRTGRVFPFGPYRESARGAERCQILLLETSSRVPARGNTGQLVGTFRRQLVLEAVNDAAVAASGPGKSLALSGIARPQVFEEGLAGLLEQEPEVALRFGDHQSYDRVDLLSILQRMKEYQCSALVTTEKDWVKLSSFWPAQTPAWVARLELQWGETNSLPQLVEAALNRRDWP